jgi:aryl-alcohol dehydrogenase-like predicted oxidoreductase
MGADPNRRGTSRRWIIREAEDSLRRLGTDWMDLCQVHRYDPGTDLDETIGALTDPVRAGKVRQHRPLHLPGPGDRGTPVDGRTARPGAPASEQPPYSILVRGWRPRGCPPARGTGWA